MSLSLSHCIASILFNSRRIDSSVSFQRLSKSLAVAHFKRRTRRRCACRSTATPLTSTGSRTLSQPPCDHPSQHAKHGRRVVKHLIVDAFGRVVQILYSSFGKFAARISIMEAIIEVCSVLDLD